MRWLKAGVATALAIALAIASGLAMAIEEPRYKLLLQEDRMELRAYAPFTVA
ncbi:MAG: heme-binding protein, partial [Betaproteobacteria bacterium]|nr:heme-binding protein [Betaproteobacteria bacterium]